MSKERLLSWLVDNRKDWNTICGIGEQSITEEEFIRLWILLDENGFHDVTMVLLTHHLYAVQERFQRNMSARLSDMEEGPKKWEAEKIFYDEIDDAPSE